MAEANSTRSTYLKRWGSLKTERSTWVDHWRELNEHFTPRRSRFLLSDTNDGRKKHGHIINSTPLRAVRVLAAGMMGGITSPARPWFKLTTPDSDLNEFGPVREYLYAVQQIIFTAYARANVYKGLHKVYTDLSVPGTSASFFEEDDEDGLRLYNVPCGQYALANSERQQVDTLYRELRMTVAQVVRRFGPKACSQRVRELYEKQEYDKPVDVLHAVEPNPDFMEGRLGPEGKRWRSCWLELECGTHEGLLREAGYDEFPVLAPRWESEGEDVYGYSPAMIALGDAKQLQFNMKRKAKAVDKVVDPAMTGPASLMGQRVSLLPGDVTFTREREAGQRFQPAHEVPAHIVQFVREDVREDERRINEAFMADLWLLMAQSDNADMTAREVAERHEEKMLQLGPVLESLNDELLDPLISRTFAILERAGRLPPPPEELAMAGLRVEYISIMAQAQRMVGIGAMDRFTAYAKSWAEVDPQVLDKVDMDQAVDEYANATGVPPTMVRSDEKVAALRDARARAKEQQAALEQAQTAAQTAKTLGDTPMGQDTALDTLLGNLGGVAGMPAGGGLPQ